MSTKLYVGNLSFNTTETDLQDLFATVGPVQETLIMQDRMTMKSRGFGFVTMSETADGAKAIAQFNGKQIEGRALTVNEARPARNAAVVVAAAVTRVVAAIPVVVATARVAATASAVVTRAAKRLRARTI